MKRPGFRGVTLVELLVAMALFGLVGLTLYLVSSQVWRQDAGLQDLLDAEQELRLKLHAVSCEIREARKVFLPARFDETIDGVGIVNARGEAIIYYRGGSPPAMAEAVTAPVGAGGEADGLYRANLNERKSECLMTDVTSFRATVARALQGQEPSCVTIYLSVREKHRKDEAGPRGTHDLFTRVFLRNFDRACPDE